MIEAYASGKDVGGHRWPINASYRVAKTLSFMLDMGANLGTIKTRKTI